MKTVLILVLLLIVFSTSIVLATVGELDINFSGDGKTTVHIGDFLDYGNDLAIQADGKIVVAGGVVNNSGVVDFGLIRLNTDGTLDSSFSGDGKLTTDFGNKDNQARGVAIDSNQKIVAVGYYHNSCAVSRYNPNGTLDLTFNGTGLSGAGRYDFAYCMDVAIQSDNKIVAVGTTSFEGKSGIFITRWNQDGSKDQSFGDYDGKNVHFFHQRDNAVAWGVAIQDDGKILAAGYVGSSGYGTYESIDDFVLLRFNIDGTIDTSFGTNGYTTIKIGDDEAFDLAIQDDGKIVVVGKYNDNTIDRFTILRFETDGTLDNSFGTSGIVTRAIGANDSRAKGVAIQDDGKILVSGYSSTGSITNMTLVRLNSDGTFDTSFDIDGVLTTDFTGYDSSAEAVALQSDDKIVIAGSTSDSSGDSLFAVARYTNSDGTDTPGLYDPDTYKWMLRNSNSFGTLDTVFRFGKPGETNWAPIAGDWNDDGIDSIGLYDPDTNIWRLRDTNSTGGLDYVFRYGKWGISTWLPITGDWDGDGTDTIGLYDQAKNLWRLRDSNSFGSWDYLFVYGKFGQANWLPVAGDWDGDGTDTIGLYDPDTAIWRLSNSNTSPTYDYIFRFGVVGETNWLPVAGDWDGDGYDSIGLYDPDTYKWRLRDFNSLGTWNYIFRFGKAGETNWIPIAGDWDGN
jgi:uncharacterized delta-60 repeat protein